jgi:type IV secretory pathway protease TraF
MSNTNLNASTWQNRLKDPNAYKQVVGQTLMWLVFCLVMVHVLKLVAPGYPIIVDTPSIQEGLYWRDMKSPSHVRGSVSSFDFEPSEQWLRERYWVPGAVHSKRIVALDGDTVTVDLAGKITVCTPSGSVTQCAEHGKIVSTDTKGRAMKSWVPLGTTYTLKNGEAWMMGEHPLSLDSRYNGPIPVSKLKGTAHLIFGWGG